MKQIIQQLNQWGKQRNPFLFVFDFELEKPFACLADKAAENGIQFNIDGFSNVPDHNGNRNVKLEKQPISFAAYQQKFDKVAAGLAYGDSFLVNLTIKTPIHSNNSLNDLFHSAKARYKLLFKNEFLVFSPESFIKIHNGRIHTFPMKGTIDASIPGAREIILNDPKELAEHVTIVDLMRNDLSLVASQVEVSRFRYLDEINTYEKVLLQVSSEITGTLPEDYIANIGTFLAQLLPAGSVSGAPKPKTLQLIRDAEGEKRGYYTGIFGYFDGHNLDSGVMIRFIENVNDQLYYRSGGGITTKSCAEKEYQEAIDKIYVPLD